MAGTLQTLIFTPQPSKTLSFLYQHPHFLANGSLLLSRSVTFNHGRLISRPIRACQPPDQVSGSSQGLNWIKPLLKFASDNFLPLALMGGVALGLANPSLGCLADKYHLSKFSTFAIFIVSGLTLRSGEIGAAAEAWPVGLFGLCSILFFTPYFSKVILQVQLQPQEFVTGLAIFSCMPTTLSSGVALTLLAGGNSALALAMTVISNLLGIMIVPFSISKFIAAGVGVSIPTKQLFRSLVLTLLIPLILGKVLRESFRGLPEFVDQNRKLFSKISAIFLSLVPWIQVSRSRSLLLMVKPQVFLVAIGMGTLLHLVLLAFNIIAVRGLSVVSGDGQSVFAKEENASSVVLVGSQKTLPVMVDSCGAAWWCIRRIRSTGSSLCCCTFNSDYHGLLPR
ncbi:putative Bile acid:sodium symporter [Melia azedarach]|uniref:Bile acid:sodium symporter n=1 Tax=Melia azedarach TaxID=155640 RepID=A0ACC1YBY5_MELAZ|nr:putative Bile acid:sodium symporter [Melia azedarach]